MRFLIYPMIAVGIIVMVTNIVRYRAFIKSLDDVISASTELAKSRFWQILALLLLEFFLVGYIFTLFTKPGLMVAGILFGGSIFVAIVLTLMFHLCSSIKKNSLTMTETLIGMIESRDPNLNGHSRYVQNLTMLFYKYLPDELKKGLNPVSLEYAALMHDVGKLGIPEAVLNKPGKLNEDEWVLMRNHPKLGAEFLKNLVSFREILPWILYHHERVDGKGYYKLSAEEIPFPAKLISVCDTYSAITMRRSYKEPMTHEVAMKIINEVAGSQLDADLVALFNKIPKEELEKCIPDVQGLV